MPVSVVYPNRSAVSDIATARTLASQIPDAHLTVVDSDTAWSPEMERAWFVILDRIVAEMGGTVPSDTPPTEAGGVTHTILFTDMEGSTTLADQLGDAAAQEVRRAHNDIVRSALNANSGSEIKHTGDGIMASFSTASSALEAAIAIQRGVAQHKEEHPDSPLGVYVGLNAGEPIAEDDDLFGTSVDLAARLVDHAQPGQIVAADVVRQLAAGKDFLFSDLGETELRGFEDPVKLWELRWQD
jgi:adenylate cyclase